MPIYPGFTFDPDRILKSRSRVLTDEGSFAGNFPGASLYRVLTGGANITMTAGSTAVTGVGTLFTTEVRVGDYVEITAQHSDTVPVLAQVDSIQSDLALTLRTAWGGITATGAAQVCDWYVYCTANAGDGIAVAAGAATLTLGIVNGSRAVLARRLGPGGRKGNAPLWSRFILREDARRANQEVTFGFCSNLATLLGQVQSAEFRLAGTVTAYEVVLVAARDTPLGLVDVDGDYLFNGGSTIDAASHVYEVEQLEDQVKWWIDGRQMGRQVPLDNAGQGEVPDPYAEMFVFVQIENTGVPAGATNLVIRDIHCKSLDVVDTRAVQPDPAKLRGSTLDITPFSGSTPRAPHTVDDNLVHEITDPAGPGMQMDRHYVVTQIGGADIQVYVAAAAPAIATLRRSPYHLFSGIPWTFSPHMAWLRLWAGKAVNDTANASLYCGASDGGVGE